MTDERVESFPVKELEIARFKIRGKWVIRWRDRITKRFVKTRSVRMTAILECEYTEKPNKYIKIEAAVTKWFLIKPEAPIEVQISDQVAYVECVAYNYLTANFGDQLLDYCVFTTGDYDSVEIEHDSLELADICEINARWKHRKEATWRHEFTYCKEYEWRC